MKIPIFDAFLNDEDLEGMSCISFVDYPAMEKEMMVFEKQKKPIMFSVQDELQHKITSVVIRCNYPIYRIDEFGKEYYIRFNREVIDQLAEKYSKDGLLNRVSVQHNGELLSDIVMTEMYIKNTEKGINPVGFEDIEDYSLFATFKINNEDVWNRIVNGEFGGLSMEVMLDLEPTNEFVESDLQSTEEFIKNEEDFFSELMNWLSDEDFEKKKKIFEANRNDILRAIKNENPILIDEGKDTATEYWVHSIGKKDGNDLVILFNPETKKWKTEYLKDIDEYIISKEKIGEFDYSDTSYKVIIDDEDIIVSHSSVATGDKFLDAIKNKSWVQISYDDEEEPKHTGFRQCIVVAYGTTSRGNVGIRCYQQFGDTRTISPDYKIFLLKRLKAFKPMNNVEKWTDDILDGRYHSGGDKNLSYPLIYAYKLGE